jgi:Plasmid pRiA4b ORF-3-like protein
MGWTNSHMYEIRAGGVGWSTPDPDWAGDFMDARKARLDDILEDIGTKTLKYLYDFGDGWEHTIRIERLVDPKPGHALSQLDRGQEPLSTRGRRWSLGLSRVA